jgi:KaiC/GvpD/RAD55 family RecA-like ATPase
VVWRTERRRGTGRATKVPKNPRTYQDAASTRPEDWATRNVAEAADQTMPPSPLGGGVGLVLGNWSDGYAIGGVDLDACRDQTDGSLDSWAREVLELLGSYAEVSPSGTGVKCYFLMEPDAVAELRRSGLLEPAGFGRSFKRGNGKDHPPAIEPHLGGRYYAVTGERLGGSPAELRVVPTGALRKLLAEIGPTFARGAKAVREIIGRHDRSAAAFAAARRVRERGGDYEDFLAALEAEPDLASWMSEKGEAAGGRELRRAWERAWPPADEHAGESASALDLHQLILEDERMLPARRWVGGPGAFPRPRLACIAGPPGVSKTTLALSISVALAAGKPFGGLVSPEAPCRVLFGAVEDEIAELRRRGHAAVCAIADRPADRRLINDNLALIDLSDSIPLFTVTPDGRLTDTEGAAKLRATIKAHRPALVVLDPLIELHTAEEASNTHMRPVLRALRAMAAEFDCVILLLHHEAKAGEGSPLQRLRGAGAIGGAIRALWSMRSITAEEAKEFGVAEDLADLFVKVETGKSQYARRRPHAWFAAEERELANGDMVHLLAPWSPPSVAVTPEMLVGAARALRAGINGQPCSTSPRAEASARLALERTGIPGRVCAKVLAALEAAGDIAIRGWRDPVDRKTRKRIWVEGNTFTGWTA